MYTPNVTIRFFALMCQTKVVATGRRVRGITQIDFASPVVSEDVLRVITESNPAEHPIEINDLAESGTIRQTYVIVWK